MNLPLRSFALAAMLFGLAGTAHAGVIDPSKPVAGETQLSLSQQWWQWALGQPAASSPITDATGAYAQANNDGKVFFLAGGTGGSTERNITLAAGKPVFFPLLNYIYATTPIDTPQGPQPDPCLAAPNPVQCALNPITPFIDAGSGLHATLDGQDLLVFPSFRQTSQALFDLMIPADNLFGAPAGTYSAVSDGYWVALKHLTPGEHTLIFGGKSGDFELEITDHLHVVPLPPTWMLLLPGLLALTVCRRHRQ